MSRPRGKSRPGATPFALTGGALPFDAVLAPGAAIVIEASKSARLSS